MLILALTNLAAQAKTRGGGGVLGFLPIILIFGAFYMISIRPQQRKTREHRNLVSAVKQGDRVIAAGGLEGTVRRVDDDTVSLQVAENVVLKVQRGSVSQVIERA